MSLVTRVNESCQTFECSIFSIGNTKNRESTRSWLIGVRLFHPWADIKRTFRMYGRVMSHTWMSHVTHINESCHTYEGGMSHI